MNKVTNEVQTVKSTIRSFLELFRKILDADACYLYLINNEMDASEKKTYLIERIEDIKNTYLKFDEKNPLPEGKSSFPEGLKCYNKEDLNTDGNGILKSIAILKFIDVAKKDGVKGWDLSFDNRPGKYVVFKKLKNDEYIRGEGLTAYMVRCRDPMLIFNNPKKVKDHPSSAFLNHKNKVSAPPCHMLIGFPLFDEQDRKIGVVKIEKYSKPEGNLKNEDNSYSYTKDNEQVIEIASHIPLLVRYIKSTEEVFKNNSYSQLFKGMDLLENLKEIKICEETSENANKLIYNDTLHLFLVLKRNEFIGYDEILTRITHYVMGIGNHLGLKKEMIKSFEDNLERFRRHEELLLSGLNNYRDHFIHQFHVFISGYIIINELGIDIFRLNIEKSMYWILSQNDKDFDRDEQEYSISEADVLRIWFLASFYHDYAYILQKLDRELENFFENILGYRFSIEFNWEDLLTNDNNFSKHICDLLKYFSSKKGTNTDTLLQNYLNAIIKIHDHGVLGALLLIKSSEKIPNRNFKECMYAALAISLHNPDVYKDLKEGDGSNKARSIGISFESFPIAFLLAFCDTAQTFGRLETKGGLEASQYPVKFFGIDINKNEKVTYKLAYLDSEKVPSAEQIKDWAHSSNEYFTSLKYSFIIEYYEPNERDLICALYF